jgi:hypothetical protein
VTQGLALSTSLNQQFMIPHTLPEKGGIVVFDGPVSFKCGIIHKRIELLAIPTTSLVATKIANIMPNLYLPRIQIVKTSFRSALYH